MKAQLEIPPIGTATAQAARERIDGLTKPLGSLGALERLAVRICAMRGTLTPGLLERRAVVVGAADHGVARAGVSAYPPEVTAQMVHGFLGGLAAISAFARTARADVYVADFGVDAPFVVHPSAIDARIGPGTRNFIEEDAMTSAEFVRAFAEGEAIAARMDRDGYEIVALGEMGIGNTTSAAAIIVALTAHNARDIVGHGTGVDAERLARKIAVVESAAAKVRGESAERVGTAVGGFEIVGLAGLIAGLAARRIPIVLDGFIVASAALLARDLAPGCLDYCIAAHRSAELGHRLALEALGLEPLLDLDLRLGEASGAALALPLIESSLRMLQEMKTFEELGVATAETGASVTSA
jgi:nicotinate-nucleotide--dimethylbenzimidazole phosphoribosyltransferase